MSVAAASQPVKTPVKKSAQRKAVLHGLPPTLEQYGAFHLVYDYLNDALFKGQLKPCFLSFVCKGNSRSFFKPNRWKKNKQEIHEISLNPVLLTEQKLIVVISNLVHEMVHLWQADFGTPPAMTGYHNQEWAEKMLEVGLQPTHNGQKDGNQTGAVMRHRIIKGGSYQIAFDDMPKDYLMPWQSKAITVHPTKPVPDKVKYHCPHAKCSATLWGKPGLLVGCACDMQGGQFVMDDITTHTPL